MLRGSSSCLLLLLAGCGASESAPPPAPPPPSTREVAAEAPAAPQARPGGDVVAADPPDDGRARAIREAEAFVRAQGYADTPATVRGDQVVHEGIEGSIEDRRSSLDPHAFHAIPEGDGWSVIFRYARPGAEGRGRMLRLRPGQPPSFVHQDLLLSAFAPR